MMLSSQKRLAISTSAALLMTAGACAPQVEIETATVNDTAADWPTLSPPPLDPVIEDKVTAIMAKMTLEQKVGQVIQADTDSVTPEEVKQYRLGSVLSGGNSAPGEKPYADAETWLAAADAFFEASIDPEGVEIAIPIIWGIDAVHGHANMTGATVFPHNIGLGAANDPDLIEDIMMVTATELIVSGHDWTFAPTLAVPRDDRWGRTYEGFSEDPRIVAAYADRIVYGLQGRPGTDGFFDSTRVISSAKHFVGDGGTTNGVDQGDTAISEAEMRDIHAAGYFPAIESGVQTVMASFNSWNGEKMHGHDYMLTDVLKGKLGFNGFVIGDWNGHGQIPGCTNTNCPRSLNAGVDMYMAPDSWKGIYESTLAAVESGEVTMARLDDAVRRILRVKLTAGVFDKPAPSARSGAGEISLLGSDAHREVARRAVRQSMVLLKNNGGLLPLNTDMTVLVVGDGADSISKQSGGWTLSWQGGGYENSDFPYGQTILDGIRDAMADGSGEIIFDPTGESEADADVVIAVYGEDPYAEFQGDLNHLAFAPNGFDTDRLAKYQNRDIPVVSVFLSGRPLWVNPEINASDAFVAAWLPGTEGGGVADVLFQTRPDYEFTGRLSFSWPDSAVDFDNNPGAHDYAPLFPLGYGLSYGEKTGDLASLSEESGLDATQLGDSGDVFRRGGAILPWRPFLTSESESVIFTGATANLDGLTASRIDHLAQEDGLKLAFAKGDMALAFLPEGDSVDWSEKLVADGALAFAVKTDADTDLTVGLGCQNGPQCAASQMVPLPGGDWREVQIPLSCFAETADLSAIMSALVFSAPKGSTIGLADIRIVNPNGSSAECES